MKNWEFIEPNKCEISAKYNDETKYYNVVFIVNAEMVETIKQNYFKANKDKYNLRGFRKGKISRKQIEQMMGGMKAIYSMAFGTYGTEKLLEYCPYKIIHITDQISDEMDDGRWQLICSVLTEHPIDDYDKFLDMNFQLPKLDPKAYVDYRIETFKKLNPYLHLKDGVVEEGDMVEVAIQSSIDGKEFKPGCEQSTNVRVVKGAVQPESLYEKLIGAKVDDTFSIETGNVSELAGRFGAKVEGKKFSLEVKVNHVYSCEEAKIDDELAISAGFESLEKWLQNLTDTANRVNTGRENQLKRQLVINHLDTNSIHPQLPLSWGVEKVMEQNPNNQSVSADHIKNICKVSRQLIILRLIGAYLKVERDDATKGKYERDDNAYAEKVLQYLVQEKARFVYVDPNDYEVGGRDKTDDHRPEESSTPVGA